MNQTGEATTLCRGYHFPLWIHGFAWGSSLLLLIAIALGSSVYRGRGVWQDWTESRELRRPAYTERIHLDDLLRTRANSYSNLAYCILGLYAIGLGWNDRKSDVNSKSYLVRTPALSCLFGVACCYLGVSSGLFHASLTRFGQQLDVASMYSPLLTILVISLGRSKPSISEKLPAWPFGILVVLVASWLLFQYKWSMSSTHVLGTLIIATGLFALVDQSRRIRERDGRWLIASSLALALAVGCRELDIAKRFSDPDAWFQGHAVWHLLTSISLGCIYLYHRSDAHLT